MSDLTRQEFVDEMVAELEDRLEGHFIGIEQRPIEDALHSAIERLEREKDQ